MSEEEYVKGYNDGLDVGKIYLKNARESLLVENEKLRADLEDTKSLLANKPISFLRPTENHDWWCVSIMERRKRVAAEKENGKLREALKSLAEHCNNMEAQNSDYHTMGEGGIPCLSQPLVNAYNLIKDDM